jgi:hypothetical protein
VVALATTIFFKLLNAGILIFRGNLISNYGKMLLIEREGHDVTTT